jgi:hypothetical protein
MRRTGSGGAGDASGQPPRRAGGFVSIGVVLALTGALVATVLGAGAFSRTLDVSDGNIWLWSSKPAQVSRVNANSGRVDMNQPLTDSRGHHVEITQNDKYLLLHDLDTGKITSVDLRRMGFTGSLDVGNKSDYAVALTGDTAALIDLTKGIVRGLDPATLHETKARLQLPGPLVGGEFDAHGALWLGIPSQGTVVSVDVSGTAASVTRTEAALTPGHDMAMSVLDGGALAVDKDGTKLALVTDRVHELTSPYPLSGAVLPARTVGSLSAVTLPATDRVVTVDGDGDKARVGSFPLAPGTTPGTATPFSGRIYVPDAKQHTVFVYDSTGHRADTLGLAGAEGPLDLEVREGHLMINAPDSSVARVVDPNGVTRIVDKYQSNLAGNNGDLAVIAAPAPQASTHNPNTGAGKAQQPDPGNQQQQTGPPGPPVPVTALAGNHQVVVSWPTPSTNGGAIQHYDVTWNGGSRRVTGNSTTVTGLTNNKAYSFSVTATNRYGTSPPAMSQEVTPTSKVPDTPTNVTAVVAPSGADAGKVTVSWKSTYQASNYLVRSADGSVTQSSVDTSVQMQNLTPGQPYTFTVVAQSSTGAASADSAPSAPVTPFAAPGVPPGLKVSDTTATSVTITWGAADDNGSPVQSYTPQLDGTNYGGVLSGTTYSHTFTGLTAGQTHTLSVYATNAAGNGQPNEIQGGAVPPAPTIQLTNGGNAYDSVTVKATVSGSNISSCTVTLNGGAPWDCSGGGSKTFTGLYASSGFTAKGSIKDGYGQTASDSLDISTKTASGTNGCTNAQGNCSVGIYSDSNQQSSNVGEWIVNTSKDAVCTKTGQSIYAYNQNAYQRSNIWLQITSPSGGYVPWAYSTMSTATRDALPTC